MKLIIIYLVFLLNKLIAPQKKKKKTILACFMIFKMNKKIYKDSV